MMQCGCPQCQVLMAQVQKGLHSYCQCAVCGAICDKCLGHGSSPMLLETENGRPVLAKKDQHKWEQLTHCGEDDE